MRTHDDIIADGCANLDGVDLITSPNGGHLVVVSVSNGTHVCQGCGEPFEPRGDKSLVESRIGGATVPVAMHAGCVLGPAKKHFFAALTERGLAKAMAGVRKLREAKRILAGANHLAEIAQESKGRIVT